MRMALAGYSWAGVAAGASATANVKTEVRNLIGLSSVIGVTGGVPLYPVVQISLNDAAGKIKARGERRGERREEN